MPTLVLPPRYSDDSQAHWRAAINAGWEVERLRSWRPPELLAGQDVTLYGEPLFAAAVANALGIILLEPRPHWLTELPDAFLRRWVRATTFGDARSLNMAAFIKPANDKCFPAKVYPWGPPASDVLEDSLPVLIAEPVHWTVEYRCFVLGSRVVTHSPYHRDGELARTDDGSWPAPNSEAKEAVDFAHTLLSAPEARLPQAVVLDVGIIQGRGWAVVEGNAAWGSGIYGCDPDEVLRVIHNACIRADRPLHE